MWLSRYRLIQFNFLHQLYITPSSSTQIYPPYVLDVAQMKEHSSIPLGSVQNYTVSGRGYAIPNPQFTVAFPLDPEVCLLGNFTNTNLRQSHTIKLTEILLAIAKKCIALK